jgi:hypothetical protein
MAVSKERRKQVRGRRVYHCFNCRKYHLLMLDFNRENLASSDINTQINALMDAAALTEQREASAGTYLGASAIGSECLRKIQFDWQVDSTHAAQDQADFRTRAYVRGDHRSRRSGRPGFASSAIRRPRGSRQRMRLFKRSRGRDPDCRARR